MWHLLLKNLLRNKRRTFLTVISVAILLFLLSSLAIVYTAMGAPLQNADAIPILMVRRATGIVFPLPARYKARIMTVPGVVACSEWSWFGGYWVDVTNQFLNLAVDADSVFDVQLGSRIPPDQLAAFKRDRTGAVAGRRLVERFKWKVGDRITLIGSPYGITPELTLDGIFTGGPDDQFWFHWDYLNEALGRPNIVGMYMIRIERPEMAGRISAAIDQLFRNTDAETKTESINAFLLDFVSLLGNIRGVITMIGSAVTFAILLIVANTMAMSIRERTQEAAVMRTLGYRPAQIVRLFVGESLVLTLCGALIGVGGAKLLYDGLALSRMGQFIFADFRMRLPTLAFCTSLAVLVGLLASGWPAYRAAKINLAEALRFTA